MNRPHASLSFSHLGLLVILLAAMLSVRPAVGATSDTLTAVRDHDRVEAVVVALFDAMRAGDAQGVREVFHADATLQTVLEDGTVRAAEIGRFADAVGAATEVWDERIRNTVVHVDGPLATAWMEYAFFAGERLSHCGINAMTFTRHEGSWKILAVVDTRTTENCRAEDWRDQR